MLQGVSGSWIAPVSAFDEGLGVRSRRARTGRRSSTCAWVVGKWVSWVHGAVLLPEPTGSEAAQRLLPEATSEKHGASSWPRDGRGSAAAGPRGSRAPHRSADSAVRCVGGSLGERPWRIPRHSRRSHDHIGCKWRSDTDNGDNGSGDRSSALALKTKAGDFSCVGPFFFGWMGHTEGSEL